MQSVTVLRRFRPIITSRELRMCFQIYVLAAGMREIEGSEWTCRDCGSDILGRRHDERAPAPRV